LQGRKEKEMESIEKIKLSYTAASLYDGGWRAEDRDRLIDEYELSEQEADTICEYIKRYEEEA
jgi:hypothetical protein